MMPGELATKNSCARCWGCMPPLSTAHDRAAPPLQRCKRETGALCGRNERSQRIGISSGSLQKRGIHIEMFVRTISIRLDASLSPPSSVSLLPVILYHRSAIDAIDEHVQSGAAKEYELDGVTKDTSSQDTENNTRSLVSGPRASGSGSFTRSGSGSFRRSLVSV